MKVMDGNMACSSIAYKLSDISFIYPITPSSPMASNMDNMGSNGCKNIFGGKVNVVEMQSEAGAAGALHGALCAGSLASTFTSSQGLLLMIPNMYKMAGEGLPAVIHVAARSLATHALSIFGDHQDVYAVRQTGFGILASTSVQDAHNLALIAHLSAIDAGIPFLHFFDGFRTSHELNMVNEISDDVIKKLVNYDRVNEFRKNALNSNKAITYGTAQNGDIYFQSVEARSKDYVNACDVVNMYMEKLNNEIGTNYKPFNYYGGSNAKVVIVAMGSVCDTIKEVILNNPLFGLVEVHLYRPFSSKYLLNVLPKSVRVVGVLDRTREHGSIGEPLYLDVLAALSDSNIRVYGGRYGLASKDVTPSDIYDIFMNLLDKPFNNFTVGINDNLSFTSLKHYNYVSSSNFDEYKIYGFGSDGMVGASKDLIKVLGNNKCVQGYFEYDSKKSGGVTVSHLRVSDCVIKAPYFVSDFGLLVVSRDEYFKMYNMFDGLRYGGILIVNSSKDLNLVLSREDKEYIVNNNISVYVIDADKIALDNNLNGKISLIMECVILKVLDFPNYLDVLIESIRKRFVTKGDDVVLANISAVRESINMLDVYHANECDGFSRKFSNNIFGIINERCGNSLSVKDLYDYRHGVFPGGTSKFEKRGISSLVPKWDVDKCIKCGMCAMVCPHAVIRPFELENGEFKIIVSEEDCTGCGLCINSCPRNALSFGKASDENRNLVNEYFNSYNNPVYPLNSIKNVELRKPLIEFPGACAGCGETPYIKLLTQIVGNRLVIANATGCSSIYGGSCPSMPYSVSWGNSLFEDAAEYGFGILNSYDSLKNRIIGNISDGKRKDELIDLLNCGDYDKISTELDSFRDIVSDGDMMFLTPKSVWTIGGDGWAYDIGFGGLDHVLSSGKRVRILVLDTEVYSNTGGQSSKSSRFGQVCEFASDGKRSNKKDLFRIAMGYSNVYVASISLGANMMQAVKAFKEADANDGPSIIIAYSPCIEHGIKGGMGNSIKEEALAVDCGYVLLMRYINGKLFIDSKEPNFGRYDEFLSGEVRYNSLKIKNPDYADVILDINKNNAIMRYKYYNNLK